jgi:hypothetical protein
MAKIIHAEQRFRDKRDQANRDKLRQGLIRSLEQLDREDRNGSAA